MTAEKKYAPVTREKLPIFFPLRSARLLYGASFRTTNALPDQTWATNSLTSVPLFLRFSAVLGCIMPATARPNLSALPASVKSIIILLIFSPCSLAIPLVSISSAR